MIGLMNDGWATKIAIKFINHSDHDVQKKLAIDAKPSIFYVTSLYPSSLSGGRLEVPLVLNSSVNLDA